MPKKAEEKRLSAILGPRLLKLLKEFETVELEDVDFDAETLELELPPDLLGLLLSSITPAAPAKPAVPELKRIKFSPPIQTYTGSIVDVRLGATKKEGGTRSRSIVIGGEENPPFYIFERPIPHEPVVAYDVFDTRISLPKPILNQYEDVLEDPAEWAKLCVKKFGAEMITIHLVSTDPEVKDTPVKKAAKIVEDVLQAVKVPLAIGGSGAPKKDPKVLEKVAESAQGERLLLASATLDTDYKRLAKAAKKYGHVLLSWTRIDINNQRLLNRKLMDLGVPKDQIVMDPTTAALGYGLEYSFSVMERIRLAALHGDELLQMPMASGSTNAWAAREAWMKSPEWGPRDLRGPLWETITALSLLLAGCDFFMMMHPAAIKTVKETIRAFMSRERGELSKIADWVRVKL